MSRLARATYPDAFFHIISKSVAGTFLFQDNSDFKEYLNLLRKYTKLYNISIHSYVLLNTHLHMIAETPFDNISNFMKSLNTSYATFINKNRNRKGHLFNGRFKSIIVDSNRYLTTLSRYIHLNPVNAHIVELPEEYNWSSLKYFVGKEKPPPFLKTNLILETFSMNREKYYEFIMEGINKEEKEILPHINNINRIEFYGTLTFGKKVISKFERRNQFQKKNKKRWSDKIKHIRYDKIIAATLSYFDESISLEELKENESHRYAKIKMILSYLLKKYSNLNITEIAGILGYKNPSAISMQLKKVNNILKEKKSDYRKDINNIIKNFEILKDRPRERK